MFVVVFFLKKQNCCFTLLKSVDPMDPGEKGARGHTRILKPAELRKLKLLGQGVFGSVHKVLVVVFSCLSSFFYCVCI